MACVCDCVAAWVVVGVDDGEGEGAAVRVCVRDAVTDCVSDAVSVCVGDAVGVEVEDGGPTMRTRLLVKSVMMARAPVPSNATSRGLLNVAAVPLPSA